MKLKIVRTMKNIDNENPEESEMTILKMRIPPQNLLEENTDTGSLPRLNKDLLIIGYYVQDNDGVITTSHKMYGKSISEPAKYTHTKYVNTTTNKVGLLQKMMTMTHWKQVNGVVLITASTVLEMDRLPIHIPNMI